MYTGKQKEAVCMTNFVLACTPKRITLENWLYDYVLTGKQEAMCVGAIYKDDVVFIHLIPSKAIKPPRCYGEWNKLKKKKNVME